MGMRTLTLQYGLCLMDSGGGGPPTSTLRGVFAITMTENWRKTKKQSGNVSLNAISTGL